jgi:hypothetical protein
MKFRPLSRGTRITVVTSRVIHFVSPFLRKCDYEIEKNGAGEKMPPRAKFARSRSGSLAQKLDAQGGLSFRFNPCMSRRFIK